MTWSTECRKARQHPTTSRTEPSDLPAQTRSPNPSNHLTRWPEHSLACRRRAVVPPVLGEPASPASPISPVKLLCLRPAAPTPRAHAPRCPHRAPDREGSGGHLPSGPLPCSARARAPRGAALVSKLSRFQLRRQCRLGFGLGEVCFHPWSLYCLDCLLFFCLRRYTACLFRSGTEDWRELRSNRPFPLTVILHGNALHQGRLTLGYTVGLSLHYAVFLSI